MSDRIYYSETAQKIARRKQVLASLVFTAMGITIGTILALLFAPESGDELRDNLGEQAKDTYNNGRDLTSSAIKRLQNDFNELREKVEKNLPS